MILPSVSVGGPIGVDVLFFRNRFWERLIVNVGIKPSALLGSSLQ